MTQSKPKMTFSSPEFAKAAESLSTRSANLNTASKRSSTPGVSDLSKSYTEAGRTTAQTINDDPIFQRLNYQDSRNFTEDSRRFDATLAAKKGAISGEQDTLRYQTDKNLEGNKYNSDANVKSTQLQANANMYGADRGVDIAKLQTDATRYGADRGVDAARIGADANRFNALLGAGTAFFNSSQYRPSFNR
jgi:hypothetical protein